MAGRPFWDKQMIAYAAFLYYRRNGHYPNSMDWLGAGVDNPSAKTVYNYFGNWENMLVAARAIEESCAVTV